MPPPEEPYHVSTDAKADEERSYVEARKIVRKIDVYLVPVMTIFYLLSFLVRSAHYYGIVLISLPCIFFKGSSKYWYAPKTSDYQCVD